MSAFTHAVTVGSHGLETDLHLSKDGVVVLSHVRRRSIFVGYRIAVLTCGIGSIAETLFRG